MTPTGSRRIHDVWFSMYSPADLPSSTRAAPAKNRIWSTIGGISSAMVTWLGLPVLRPSAATRTSAALCTSSAKSSSAFCRADGVVRFQSLNAAAAAAYALSTSSAFEIGAVPYFSPVVGSTSDIVAPLTESTSSPPMKFCTVVTGTAPSSSEVREDQGEHVEALVDELVADGERRQEAQHVAERPAGQHDDACGVGARAERLGEFGVGLASFRP